MTSSSRQTTQQQLTCAPRVDRDMVSYQDERMSHPRRSSHQDYQHVHNHHQSERYHEQKGRGENPLMTVWRETYEVWDGVLEVVGKAWFKMGGK